MPLEYLFKQVEPKACHLINSPTRLWVFGGSCDSKPNEPAKSLRDSFWKQSLLNAQPQKWIAEFDRPEQHEHWWAFSGYDNLLTFERDACYLAKGIILFAESPGSLAELGALAIDDAILPKLLVVVQSKYLEQDKRESFLNLGPLKRLQNHNGLCVIGATSNAELVENDFEAIVDSIDSWLPTTHKTSVLSKENPTHRLLLLADLVDLLLVSKLTELKDAAHFFNVAMTEVEISRALALLDFFGFVKQEMRGLEKFWVRNAHSGAPWVDYTAKHGHRFERSGFKINCMEMINKDDRRKALLARSR